MEKFLGKMKRLLIFLFCLVMLSFLVIFISNPPPRRYQETSDLGIVDGWEFNTSRDASQYIFSDNSTIVKPKRFCDSPVFLLIIVCSAPANLLNRNAIRETWGSQKEIGGKPIEVYFLMGDSYNTSLQQDIVEENDRYNDIIQDHFVDTYNNLTLKSIVMLKLVSTYCLHSTIFMMKTDDDMFLNMPPLVAMLNATNTSNVLVGSLICGAKPIKDASNKWYSPSYMYKGRIYPNYLSGTGYVMSIDVVPKLFDAALVTPIFHLEDIYITGILSKAISLRPRNNGGFTFEKRRFDPCVFKTAFTSHRLSPQEINDQFRQLQAIDLAEECRLQQTSKNSSFNHMLSYLPFGKTPPKKKKKPVCF